jgi:hypothetical protein
MTDAELDRIERDARAVAAAGAEEVRTERECQALADLHLAVLTADERTRIQVAANDRRKAALGRYCDLHNENLREADALALVAEIRRLRAKEPGTTGYEVAVGWRDRFREAEARVKALEADARRLDWLDRRRVLIMRCRAPIHDDAWKVETMTGPYIRPALRDAIDAAMEMSGQPEKDA